MQVRLHKMLARPHKCVKKSNKESVRFLANKHEYPNYLQMEQQTKQLDR